MKYQESNTYMNKAHEKVDYLRGVINPRCLGSFSTLLIGETQTRAPL